MRMKSRAEVDNENTGLTPLYRYWQPQYWGLWLALLLLWAVTLLPFRLQMRVGQALGRMAMPLMKKRRNIARVNLRLCFPELDSAAIETLVGEHFESLGISMIETVLAWRISARRVTQLIDMTGLDIPIRELKQGHAVILLSGHFPAGEVVGIAVEPALGTLAAMYRPVNNPLADQVVRRARNRTFAHLVPKDAPRQMLKLLKQGIPFWYASDQAYDRKGSALIPFFGEPAMTSCALTQIAKISGAKVIPFIPRRKADLSGYEVVFKPPLENFPTEDAEADALRVHQVLEEAIREAPAQYYWVHRRFKNRPPPHSDPYADL